jgi:hypothetical protein
MSKVLTVNGMTVDELLAFHRAHFGDARMAEGDGGDGGDGKDGKDGDGFKPITSQDDLTRVITERVNRERAKFADYTDLKTKAAKLDQLEQANKSETDKFSERIASLETENTAIKSQAVRSRIQAKFSVSDEDAELFLTGADEASLTKQAERLAARDTERKKQGNRVPKEGTSTKSGAEPMREFARNLFGAND